MNPSARSTSTPASLLSPKFQHSSIPTFPLCTIRLVWQKRSAKLTYYCAPPHLSTQSPLFAHLLNTFLRSTHTLLFVSAVAFEGTEGVLYPPSAMISLPAMMDGRTFTVISEQDTHTNTQSRLEQHQQAAQALHKQKKSVSFGELDFLPHAFSALASPTIVKQELDLPVFLTSPLSAIGNRAYSAANKSPAPINTQFKDAARIQQPGFPADPAHSPQPPLSPQLSPLPPSLLAPSTFPLPSYTTSIPLLRSLLSHAFQPLPLSSLPALFTSYAQTHPNTSQQPTQIQQQQVQQHKGSGQGEETQGEGLALSRDNFIRLLSACMTPTAAQHQRHLSTLKTFFTHFFSFLDRDGDQWIDYHLFGAGMALLLPLLPAANQVEEAEVDKISIAFQLIDRENTGEITPVSLYATAIVFVPILLNLSYPLSQSTPVVSAVSFRSCFDLPSLQASIYEIAGKIVRESFGCGDVNIDGVMSEEEFRALHLRRPSCLPFVNVLVDPERIGNGRVQSPIQPNEAYNTHTRIASAGGSSSNYAAGNSGVAVAHSRSTSLPASIHDGIMTTASDQKWEDAADPRAARRQRQLFQGREVVPRKQASTQTVHSVSEHGEEGGEEEEEEEEEEENGEDEDEHTDDYDETQEDEEQAGDSEHDNDDERQQEQGVTEQQPLQQQAATGAAAADARNVEDVDDDDDDDADDDVNVTELMRLKMYELTLNQRGSHRDRRSFSGGSKASEPPSATISSINAADEQREEQEELKKLSYRATQSIIMQQQGMQQQQQQQAQLKQTATHTGPKHSSGSGTGRKSPQGKAASSSTAAAPPTAGTSSFPSHLSLASSVSTPRLSSLCSPASFLTIYPHIAPFASLDLEDLLELFQILTGENERLTRYGLDKLTQTISLGRSETHKSIMKGTLDSLFLWYMDDDDDEEIASLDIVIALSAICANDSSEQLSVGFHLCDRDADSRLSKNEVENYLTKILGGFFCLTEQWNTLVRFAQEEQQEKRLLQQQQQEQQQQQQQQLQTEAATATQADTFTTATSTSRPAADQSGGSSTTAAGVDTVPPLSTAVSLASLRKEVLSPLSAAAALAARHCFLVSGQAPTSPTTASSATAPLSNVTISPTATIDLLSMWTWLDAVRTERSTGPASLTIHSDGRDKYPMFEVVRALYGIL